MIACVQRVTSAAVHLQGKLMGAVDKGLLVLLAVEKGDTPEQAAKMAQKILNLRIFPDELGKMSLSVREINGEVLVVSQFTLAATTDKGNRPDFGNAAPPEEAEALYEEVIKHMEDEIYLKKGAFGGDMKVSLVNDGPVTILINI